MVEIVMTQHMVMNCFLGGRQSSSNAGQNFLPTHQMPLLARGNFNPEFISVLSHKQNDTKNLKSK